MSVTLLEEPPAVTATAPAASDARESAAPQQNHRWWVSASVLAGTFMVVLDSTVVNVSLPHIAGSLSATVEESTWALTSYLAANAVILPMTGWLANYFGRRRLLILSVSGFTIASFLCGLAPTLGFLIACRIVQGASGGVMQPLSQAIMLEAFPARERGEAMAVWGLGIVVAPILGPVIGGWLTDDYSWRWIFYINIPVGILAISLIRRFIFDPPYIRRRSERIDYWGLGLLTIGIAALQIGLDKGQEEDWLASHLIAALLVTAAIALVVLVVHEVRSSHPVIDLRVFLDRTYTTGVILITLLGFVLFGSLVLLPIMLQTLLGYPPLQAGIAMAPRGVGTLLITPVVAVLISRVDPRTLLAAGFVTVAVTMYWLATMNLEAGYWDFFWPQIVQGAGFGLLFVPLTTVTMDAFANQAMGNATSLFNLMRNIGGSIGIATVTTMLARDQQANINALGANVTPYSPATQHMLDAIRGALMARGADAVTATRQAYGAVMAMIQRQAAILAFLDAFRLLAILFLLLTPLILLMGRPRHMQTGGGSSGKAVTAPADAR